MLDGNLQETQKRRHWYKQSFRSIVAAWAVLLCFLMVPLFLSAQQQVAKTVEGKVFNAGPTPLPGSIIYLQDQRTNVIKTLIATADGGFRFGQLPADTDYRLWAEYKGKKSKIRLISSFDTKLDVTYDFHISE